MFDRTEEQKQVITRRLLAYQALLKQVIHLGLAGAFLFEIYLKRYPTVLAIIHYHHPPGRH